MTAQISKTPIFTETQTTVSLFSQNIAAMAFGAILLFAVGFLPMEVAHNAAHDTRHALAFPCH
ncbi:MAG: CbtB-domain containing protein [Pseudomonadales bacterium]|nr:CbtB-domain containing protein [Pseudomonadales bacterium]